MKTSSELDFPSDMTKNYEHCQTHATEAKTAATAAAFATTVAALIVITLNITTTLTPDCAASTATFSKYKRRDFFSPIAPYYETLIIKDNILKIIPYFLNVF